MPGSSSQPVPRGKAPLRAPLAVTALFAGLLLALPGASGTVTFTVTAHDPASRDTGSDHWIARAGNYQILVGDSSRDLPLSGGLTLSSAITADAMD
jgi:hypothetical protein